MNDTQTDLAERLAPYRHSIELGLVGKLIRARIDQHRTELEAQRDPVRASELRGKVAEDRALLQLIDPPDDPR